MYKIILACDERDEALGAFFRACVRDLKSAIKDISYEIIEISSGQLNQFFIELQIAKVNPKPFIFIAYSHGSENAFLGANGTYVKANENTKQFSNSLCYSFACNAAQELGPDLIKNDCLSFWGYNKEATIYSTYQQVFVECANYGFKQLLSGDTTQKAFDKMKDFYNQQVDFIADKNYFVASILMENRDALTLLGDKKLLLTHFEN